MRESLFSQSWYRVASLTPRMRSHVQIHHHTYRGQDWFIIQDHFTGKHHRFSVEAYQVIGLMNGRRTLQEIWETACARLGEHMPPQDEVIALLAQLHRFDLLQAETALPDFEDLHKRRRSSRHSRFVRNLRSPLSIPFPLLDPEKFLARSMPLVRPLFSRFGALVWLGVVCSALILAGLHWSDLTDNISDQILSLQNLAVMALIYPAVKIIHEFGHAYMVKRWGGEVHEMGVLFLVFIPIPYVDASASLSFRDKYQRMLVGGAGILVELFLAGLAMLVWVNVGPGAVRAGAFNLMLIAGVSTVLFNGNPLVRYDAYYVLTDLLEIPNMGTRGVKHMEYLCQKYLLGMDAESPATSSREAAWLGLYAAASLVYRIILSVKIILFIAGRFFVFGILIALWATVSMAVMPLFRIGSFLLRNGSLQNKRSRMGVVLLPVFLLLAALFLLPVPYYTTAQGIVQPSEDSQIYASADSFIRELPVQSGSRVEAGTVLLRCEDPELAARVGILDAQKKELEARYQLSRTKDLAEAEIFREEILRVEAELSRAVERREALQVYSGSAGVFLLPRQEEMIGRFVRRGMLLAYVLDPARMHIRVLVPQEDIDRIRNDTKRVTVRMADRIGKVLPARIVRQIPEATHELPSMVLSTEGNGLFALDPKQKEKAQVFERLFQLDLLLEDPVADKVEERVYVRFEHSFEPLAYRGWHAFRRLLMGRFDV